MFIVVICIYEATWTYILAITIHNFYHLDFDDHILYVTPTLIFTKRVFEYEKYLIYELEQ